MMAFSSGLSVPTISAREEREKEKAESRETQKILRVRSDMQKTRGRREDRLCSPGEPDLS